MDYKETLRNIQGKNFGQENMLANNDELSALGLSTKTIHYDLSELKRIQTALLEQHNYRYKKHPIDTIKIIRNLRLNCKRRRHLYTAQKDLGTDQPNRTSQISSC